jgi:hypothetical protein
VISAGAPTQRIRDKGQQHLPGDETWLIGEQRASGEKKYYLASQRAETNLRTLAAIIKARWICEQAHQQMKEELGLDHFEGRSWQGPAPTRAHDNDRVRLPSASSPIFRSIVFSFLTLAFEYSPSFGSRVTSTPNSHSSDLF